MLDTDNFTPANEEKIESIKARLKELISEKQGTEELIFLEGKRTVLTGLETDFKDLEPLQDRLKLLNDFINEYYTRDSSHFWLAEGNLLKNPLLKFITAMLLSLPPLTEMGENDKKRAKEIYVRIASEEYERSNKKQPGGRTPPTLKNDLCAYFRTYHSKFPEYYNPDSQESRENHPILGTNTVLGKIFDPSSNAYSNGYNYYDKAEHFKMLKKDFTATKPMAPKPSVFAKFAAFFSGKPTGAELDDAQVKEPIPPTKGPGKPPG